MVASEGISGRSLVLIIVCQMAEWWAENGEEIVIVWIKRQWPQPFWKWLECFEGK